MKIRAILGALILLVSGQVGAAIVNELDVALGDTGDKPSTASILYGNGSLTQIDGYITGDSRRVDMYGIYLSTSELFAAYTTITVGDPGELSVFLFDDQGIGIVGAKQGQRLNNIVPSYTGLHYLAVAQGQTFEPYALTDSVHNFHNPIFTTNTSFGYHIPGGPAANLPVSGWGGTVSGNYDEYSIFLQGASLVPSPVPIPATLLLFGTGLLGLIGFSKRRKAA